MKLCKQHQVPLIFSGTQALKALAKTIRVCLKMLTALVLGLRSTWKILCLAFVVPSTVIHFYFKIFPFSSLWDPSQPLKSCCCHRLGMQLQKWQPPHIKRNYPHVHNIVRLLQARVWESLGTTFSSLALIKISWALICLFAPLLEVLLKKWVAHHPDLSVSCLLSVCL